MQSMQDNLGEGKCLVGVPTKNRESIGESTLGRWCAVWSLEQRVSGVVHRVSDHRIDSAR